MGLIICLLALSTFSSCEDPNRIGLDVQPEEDLINAIYVDNLPVNTYTMMRDSVYTYSSGGYLVGSYLDPQFGRVTAEAYGQMYTSGINFPAGETRTLDSIVMILDYAYNYYGDTSKIQHFKIYQLQDTLTAPLYANSEKSVKAGAALLGETSFKPNPGGTDAVAWVKLNPALGTQILSKQTWTHTELSRDFPSWFVIKPDVENNTCILDFAILKDNSTSINPKSEVKIYYKGTSDGATTAKTLSLQIVNGNRFNRIKGNRTGTLFSNLSAPDLISSSTTNQLVAVQGGTGIRGYLHFPFLDNIPQYFNGANKIKIVKAELELKSQYATGETIAPAALYLSQPREKYPQTRVPLIDVDKTIGLTTESYMYNTSGNFYTASREILSKQDSANHLYTYTLPLTSYFNNVLQGQVANNGLIITSASTRTSVSRLLFGDQNNTTNPLRLKLYYIKLD